MLYLALTIGDIQDEDKLICDHGCWQIQTTGDAFGCPLSRFLINAHNIENMLWFFRLFDHSMEGFKNWEFMTIHCWGERAAGDWILEVYDTPSQLRNFKTPGKKSFQVHLFCRRKWWTIFEPKNVPHLPYSNCFGYNNLTLLLHKEKKVCLPHSSGGSFSNLLSPELIHLCRIHSLWETIINVLMELEPLSLTTSQ